jgi:hypothetical protein
LRLCSMPHSCQHLCSSLPHSHCLGPHHSQQTCKGRRETFAVCVLLPNPSYSQPGITCCSGCNNSRELTFTLPAYPSLQVPKAGWPSTQAGAALAKGVAGFLHAPQLAGSLSKFASHPLLGFPSQLANLRENKVLCVMHMLLSTRYSVCQC